MGEGFEGGGVLLTNATIKKKKMFTGEGKKLT